MCLILKTKEVYSTTESADTFHTKLFILLFGIAVHLSILSYICHGYIRTSLMQIV